MSNESNGKHETIADIVAALRAIAYIQTAESPSSVLSFANRIEAAAKRQFRDTTKTMPEKVAVSKMETTAPTCSKSSQVGNAAALREALLIARKAICHHAEHVCRSLSWENSNIQSNCADILCAHRDLCEAKTAINAALSAPPRNCDV